MLSTVGRQGEIQVGKEGGHHLGKISGTVGQIATKFGTMKQFDPLNHSDHYRWQ